jgi:hypothetical protein
MGGRAADAARFDEKEADRYPGGSGAAREEAPAAFFLAARKAGGRAKFLRGARRLFKPLEDKLNRLSDQPSVAFPLKRAKGPRKRFIKELAEKFGVKQRMVIRCIDET